MRNKLVRMRAVVQDQKTSRLSPSSNPWLSRDAVIKCFKQAFPNKSYGEQEYNKGDSGQYQYHLQYTPGLGGATGFSPYIHAHGH